MRRDEFLKVILGPESSVQPRCPETTDLAGRRTKLA
jgi:hypothetical protein